ncbi:hypothetical protein R3W88_033497 [Solanum pinnatisectum]|uniref:Uncharacterized protein n=1 Tax=Solanum pinnatisectum TaxID=50273 RepID=A0AAV9K0T6_9SOLN|nr:hypothetical protein R3W88_033497 [Solanum pinnatisectum]
MGFSRLSCPIVPFNSLGTSSILLLPSYKHTYFQKAIVTTTSDEMVNLLCSCSNLLDIETIEITNKHTCQVFSLTLLFQLPTRPNFPSP